MITAAPRLSPNLAHIFVCGENEIKAAVISSILLPETIRVLFVRSARHLLDGLAQAVPNLLLIDAMAPVLDGPALVRLLRRRTATRTLPIILLAPEEVTIPDNTDAVVLRGPIVSSDLRKNVHRLLKAS